MRQLRRRLKLLSNKAIKILSTWWQSMFRNFRDVKIQLNRLILNLSFISLFMPVVIVCELIFVNCTNQNQLQCQMAANRCRQNAFHVKCFDEFLLNLIHCANFQNVFAECWCYFDKRWKFWNLNPNKIHFLDLIWKFRKFLKFWNKRND